MSQSIILTDGETKQRAADMILALPDIPVHQMQIKLHKVDRSLAQNGLYWVWLTIIAGERGQVKDEIHLECKKRFLIPIFERDNPEYAEMIQSVRTVWKSGLHKDAHSLKRQIIKLTSTRDADTKQFTEYLNDIERDAQEKGVWLPHPEDQYNQAMGVK